MDSRSGSDVEGNLLIDSDDEDYLPSDESAESDISDITDITHSGDITHKIKKLRKVGFDKCVYDKELAQELLTVDNQHKLDVSPFHQHEYEIQALRYLKGMFIIAENLGD